MAKVRKRVNHIGRLRRRGRVIEQVKDIKEEVASFFEALCKGESVTQPTLEGPFFPSISIEAQR